MGLRHCGCPAPINIYIYIHTVNKYPAFYNINTFNKEALGTAGYKDIPARAALTLMNRKLKYGATTDSDR